MSPEKTPPSDPYLHPYREAQELHGSGFNVTLWASESTQRVRFETFAEMIYFAGKRVLDAGCSRGDFASFLLERGMAYERYVGIDGLAEVIAFAHERAIPNSEFVAGDFVTHPELLRTGDPQVVVISGTLNTMDTTMALQVLDAAWDAAGESLIFNFLSDRCGPKAMRQEHPARRLPTQRMIDWALSKTWHVRFRQDYMPNGHDATIAMVKR